MSSFYQKVAAPSKGFYRQRCFRRPIAYFVFTAETWKH